MTKDSSYLLFQKYFSLKNRNIEVELRNSTQILGRFLSFSKGIEEWDDPFIFRWYFVDIAETDPLGMDEKGNLTGQYIQQKNIKRIKFLEDNTEMYF